jgi:hypothetical protein
MNLTAAELRAKLEAVWLRPGVMFPNDVTRWIINDRSELCALRGKRHWSITRLVAKQRRHRLKVLAKISKRECET